MNRFVFDLDYYLQQKQVKDNISRVERILSQNIICLHGVTDNTRLSGSRDPGSIPGGDTIQPPLSISAE